MKLYWAVILDIWKDEPVFHRPLWEPGRGAHTVCGRPIATWKPQLPMKHAVKFARPCLGCFPDGYTEGS